MGAQLNFTVDLISEPFEKSLRPPTERNASVKQCRENRPRFLNEGSLCVKREIVIYGNHSQIAFRGRIDILECFICKCGHKMNRWPTNGYSMIYVLTMHWSNR